MKKADKILIVCIMIVAVVLCVPLFFSENENAYASVYVKEKQVLRIDLSKDKTYVVNGKLGKVRVTQEKSPHHYCSKQGYVSDANVPIVCLPNETVVKIEKEASQDTVIQ